jgi:transcriptional regulator with XRE-family HTH domain
MSRKRARPQRLAEKLLAIRQSRGLSQTEMVEELNSKANSKVILVASPSMSEAGDNPLLLRCWPMLGLLNVILTISWTTK